ncbi:FAD-dependent thymidylate synthase [Desulfovibrio litoralis]|uniref:Flavin-dependent thymidylate synthase n=1 Tax=Desulfovibrio litoralis DSM 11393 TaxID=1121455 RepID=A0A1M7RU38_9BACT|nr:FAD-dependent thymidylate synthase [Desulfovibrio litoralis]SHN49789.1 thymidylate synthase (FAD) [Desulfovibrio litoralis DSM 11393]
MPPVSCNVKILNHTPEPLALIYAAFRQCYHSGYIVDMWERLLSGAVSKEEQAEFVRKVIESGHTSPIEHVSFTFAAEGISRALSHQLVRHRIASYSQQSQRYVNASAFNYILPPAIAKNPEAKACFEKCMLDITKAYGELKELLEKDGRGDKAKEDARFVLPQATETRIVFTMNCRSLLNFFEHRCCLRAQWEIRHLAELMLEECKEVLPVVFQYAGAKCESLGYCPESEKFTCGRYPQKS